MKPIVAWCVARRLQWSGSEVYRAHIPVGLAQRLGWAAQVVTKWAPIMYATDGEAAGELDRPGDPWVVEMADKGVIPHVVIMRPVDAAEDLATGEKMKLSADEVYRAREYGQIIICDLDDDPWSWASYHGEQLVEHVHDWIGACDAVWCSTQALIKIVQGHYPDMNVVYAPDTWDVHRFSEVVPPRDGSIGSHLLVKARSGEDMTLLGDTVRPLMAARPDLIFKHVGESVICVRCDKLPEEHISAYPGDCVYAPPVDGQLAFATGIPADRVALTRTVPPAFLPSVMTWDVGVIPLAGSLPFNAAKTETKGVEMGAASIPWAFVGDHPLYGSVTPDECRARIERLLDDPWYWEKESKRLRRWAYSLAREHQRDYLKAMATIQERAGNVVLTV